jgi:hypothetical protein
MTKQVKFSETPLDEIYRIRQEISAQYGHSPEKLYLAMVSDQREQARKGQVFWGYNADGVLVPLSTKMELCHA